jgi:RAB protein geranylgeranyltransferase component A
MEYKASLDTLAKGTTIGVFILFIAIAQQSVRALLVDKGDTAGIKKIGDQVKRSSKYSSKSRTNNTPVCFAKTRLKDNLQAAREA